MDEQALREALSSEATEHAFDSAAVGRAVERGRAHRRRRRTVLVVAVPVVALAAAGGMTAALRGGPDDGPVAGPAESTPAPTPLPLLTQRNQPEMIMLANASGIVTVAENGCLALATGNGLMPIAWGAGSTAAVGDDGRAVLYDADGRRQATEGDRIEVAGGYGLLDSPSDALVGSDECALGETSVFLAQGPVEVMPGGQTG